MISMSKIFGVSLVGLVAASVAAGATITYSSPTDFAGIPITDTYNFSGTFGAGYGPADNGAGSFDPQQNAGGMALPFKQFDPAYGTLTGVSISITGLIGTNNDPLSQSFGQNSILSLTNNSGSQQTYNELYSIHLFLMDRDAACMANVENNATAEAASGCMLSSLSLNFENNGEVLENGQTVQHNLANSGVFNAFSGITGTINNISRFVGTGAFPLQIFLESTNLVTNGSGTAQDSVAVFAGASGSITYTYDAAESSTPEPGSMFLMGGAMVGLGILRRRLAR